MACCSFLNFFGQLIVCERIALKPECIEFGQRASYLCKANHLVGRVRQVCLCMGLVRWSGVHNVSLGDLIGDVAVEPIA